MKKFILTSPAFEGEINVLYGTDGKLMYVDFMKSDLSEEQMQFFKEKLPVYLTPGPSPQGDGNSSVLASHFGKSKLNVVEQGYSVSFEQWWTRYNLKRNRERCEKIWNKLSEADRAAAFFKLALYERRLSLDQWRTKAEPDTYLRNKYWNNDWK